MASFSFLKQPTTDCLNLSMSQGDKGCSAPPMPARGEVDVRASLPLVVLCDGRVAKAALCLAPPGKFSKDKAQRAKLGFIKSRTID